MSLPDSLASFGDPEKTPTGEIYVDAEGDWYHQGNRMTREDIIELFLRNVERAPEGHYQIHWNQNRCALETADTPFVITRVDRGRSADTGVEEVQLKLKHLTTPELLDPETLRSGKDNVLYCLLRGGEAPARFSRPAYYQLAQWIEEDGETGEIYLELNGRRYVIQMGEEAGR